MSVNNAIIATLREWGYKVNNYIEDATDNAAGNLKFDSTTDQTYTVPTDSRWILIGGVVNRDANETLLVQATDSAGKVLITLANEAAGTGETALDLQNQLIVLDEGEIVQITFGGAQGAGAYASLVVIEVNGRG